MAVKGLFTRVELQGGKKSPAAQAARQSTRRSGSDSRSTEPQIDPSNYWKQGLSGVESMNPEARSRHIEPVGSEAPSVYFLGEAPGADEDENGEPFVGKSGRMLRDLFPRGWFPSHIRINNVVRTRPINREKTGRQPTFAEVECYRPSLIEDIERSQPAAIVGVGGIALNWMLPGVGSIVVARGKRFPVQVGSHRCWFYPVHHPAFLMRILDSRFQDIPGEEWLRSFELDVRRVFKDVSAGLPEPTVEDPNSYDEGIELFDGSDPVAIANAIKLMREGKLGMVDLETSKKRPYDGGKILTVGISRGEYTIAFPIHHPGAKWQSPADRDWVEKKFVEFIKDPVPKGCQNGNMELEWIGYTYGKEVLRCSDWHDTRAQAYIHYGVGGQSLNFLTALEFGFQLKDKSDVDVSNLTNTPLPQVLRYNARDAKYQHKLWFRQNKWIKEEGLTDVYLEQIRRLPTLIIAQLLGIPTDQAKVTEFAKKCDDEAVALRTKIMGFEEARQYQRMFNAPFDPDKDRSLLKLFGDVMKREEVKRGDAFSTDKDVLALLQDNGVTIAAPIQRLRQVKTLKSRYVTPMRLGAKKAFVKSDGRLHTILKAYSTASRRLASEEPNNQNWPKRRDVWVRAIMAMVESILGRKCTLVSADYGQIEYRMIGNCSGDKYIIDSCFSGYDVHMARAERILQVYDKTFKERHGDKPKKEGMKAWRAEVKNQEVFPYFYRSKPKPIADALMMPPKLYYPLFEELEAQFAGIKPWQDEQIRLYRERNYIELLTGFRRYGPLSDNMICNTIPQGTACDVVVDGMCRLSELAQETDRWYLSPVLMIHDDLWFIIPDEYVGDSIPTIVQEMCNCAFKFLKVPLGIEVSVGKNAADMVDVGKYESHKLVGGRITVAETSIELRKKASWLSGLLPIEEKA